MNCILNDCHASPCGQISNTAAHTVEMKWCNLHQPLILDPFTFRMDSRIVRVQQYHTRRNMNANSRARQLMSRLRDDMKSPMQLRMNLNFSQSSLYRTFSARFRIDTLTFPRMICEGNQQGFLDYCWLLTFKYVLFFCGKLCSISQSCAFLLIMFLSSSSSFSRSSVSVADCLCALQTSQKNSYISKFVQVTAEKLQCIGMGTIIADNYLIFHRLVDKARKFKISRRIAVVLLRNVLLITEIFYTKPLIT